MYGAIELTPRTGLQYLRPPNLAVKHSSAIFETFAAIFKTFAAIFKTFAAVFKTFAARFRTSKVAVKHSSQIFRTILQEVTLVAN
jgi:hypothetical protein